MQLNLWQPPGSNKQRPPGNSFPNTLLDCTDCRCLKKTSGWSKNNNWLKKKHISLKALLRCASNCSCIVNYNPHKCLKMNFLFNKVAAWDNKMTCHRGSPVWIFRYYTVHNICHCHSEKTTAYQLGKIKCKWRHKTAIWYTRWMDICTVSGE